MTTSESVSSVSLDQLFTLRNARNILDSVITETSLNDAALRQLFSILIDYEHASHLEEPNHWQHTNFRLSAQERGEWIRLFEYPDIRSKLDRLYDRKKLPQCPVFSFCLYKAFFRSAINSMQPEHDRSEADQLIRKTQQLGFSRDELNRIFTDAIQENQGWVWLKRIRSAIKDSYKKECFDDVRRTSTPILLGNQTIEMGYPRKGEVRRQMATARRYFPHVNAGLLKESDVTESHMPILGNPSVNLTSAGVVGGLIGGAAAGVYLCSMSGQTLSQQLSILASCVVVGCTAAITTKVTKYRRSVSKIISNDLVRWRIASEHIRHLNS